MVFLIPLHSRASDVTMHKSDAEPKNDFLQDLDKEQVSVVGVFSNATH